MRINKRILDVLGFCILICVGWGWGTILKDHHFEVVSYETEKTN